MNENLKRKKTYYIGFPYLLFNSGDSILANQSFSKIFLAKKIVHLSKKNIIDSILTVSMFSFFLRTFSDVYDFEFTRECIVFDLLKIALYHGWLVDPQNGPAVKAVGNLSYNQIVEKMLTSQDGEYDDVTYFLFSEI